MNSAMMTPSERLRPRMGIPHIEYGPNGKPVSRIDYFRPDPDVSAGERRFSNAFEFVVSWIAFLGMCAFGWWALTEGTKLVYSFAFNHPIGR